MILTLIPQFFADPAQAETTLSVRGDTLIVDETPYDLASVPEGGEAWPDGADPHFVGPIQRIGGVLNASVIVRLGATAASDQPGSPWIVDHDDGAVPIPAARNRDEEAAV